MNCLSEITELKKWWMHEYMNSGNTRKLIAIDKAIENLMISRNNYYRCN